MVEQSSARPRSGWSLDQRDPKTIQYWMPVWGWFYQHYFRVKTSGWEHISPDQTTLFVGSHNGGFSSPDMFMTFYAWFQQFGIERPVYGLMHENVWKINPAMAHEAVKVGAIQAHPKMAIAALKQGASVLVYPGGAEDVFRPHWMRDQIYFAGRQGFIKLALRHEVPIVPIISVGAHDTLLVLADIYPIAQQLHEWGLPWWLDIDPVVFPIYLGLPWGLAIGPLPHLPLPVPIHIRICPPIVFDRYGQEAATDRAYVQACYNRVRQEMQQSLDKLVKSYDQA